MTFVSLLPIISRKGAFGPLFVPVPPTASATGYTLRIDSATFTVDSSYSSCQIALTALSSPDGVALDTLSSDVYLGGPAGSVLTGSKTGTLSGGGTFSTAYRAVQVGGSYNVTNSNTGLSTSALFGISVELW